MFSSYDELAFDDDPLGVEIYCAADIRLSFK
jgi:hypothetical protein